MPAIEINSWITSLLDRLQQKQQRQLVVLQGPQSWCDAQFDKLFVLDNSMPVLSNRNLVAAAIPFNKADTCLGSEARLVALDLFDGFNPDALCIATGLVRAGGILLLLSPSPEDWDMATDRYARWQGRTISRRAHFAEYFFGEIDRDESIGIVLTPGFDFEAGLSIPELEVLEPTPIEQGLTAEQTRCLPRIEQWLERTQSRVALITAARGRGKSTCLGLLVERLQSSYRILVSAKSKQTAAQLLRLAPEVEFVAPDRLLRTCPEADLLIIDEAAMIPLSMLRQLIRLYPRMVMATTCGGYEGTGQGFMLRFVATIDPKILLQLELEKPVRWCQHDPLETWLDKTLMLSSDESSWSCSDKDASACELQVLETPGAASCFPLLQQVYALLNSAHYRTRPSDLRMLMENPDLVLVIARCQERVVGAALLNVEGGLDDELCEEIFLGRRRPRGHLLAQMLTAHSGLKNFASFRGIRVQRIAVTEAHRRHGLGTDLIERALRYSRDNSMAYLGASFALDSDTACFWRQAGFTLVHVSYGQGKSSGDQTIAVLIPIRQELRAGIKLLQQRINQQLPIWMTQFLQYMDARQVVALLRFAGFSTLLSELEQREIEAFTRGNKGFELCFASLQKSVMQGIARTTGDPDNLLIEKAIQNRHWDMLERESGSEGRKQLQQRLRLQVEALLKA